MQIIATGNAVADTIVNLAAALAAVAFIWRVWVKPTVSRIVLFMRAVEALAELVTTEFNTNGGSTIKDAVIATLQWQRAHSVWSQERAEELNDLIREVHDHEEVRSEFDR